MPGCAATSGSFPEDSTAGRKPVQDRIGLGSAGIAGDACFSWGPYWRHPTGALLVRDPRPALIMRRAWISPSGLQCEPSWRHMYDSAWHSDLRTRHAENRTPSGLHSPFESRRLIFGFPFSAPFLGRCDTTRVHFGGWQSQNSSGQDSQGATAQNLGCQIWAVRVRLRAARAVNSGLCLPPTQRKCCGSREGIMNSCLLQGSTG